jgi:long-chain acyl-CoA synthetase
VGLRRVKVGVTAGGPIPLETQTLWQIWGVDLKNLYGQTEGGFIAVQQEAFPRPGDVGTPAPSMTLRLAQDGEILVRGPGSFVNYWGEAVSGREGGGWVATGDVGSLTPEGHLRIVDRKKDLIITQGGKNISPQVIEDKLRASPYIAEAVVFGEGQRYLVALIEIDEETVAHWARSQGLTVGGFTALAAAREVCDLIQGAVEAVNHELARVEQIKAFRILPRALDPEVEGEPVTPTRKIKRRMMYERFRDLVDAMYGDGETARIAEQVGP